MCLKVAIQLGENIFEAEGDFAFDDGFATVFGAWVDAQEGTSGQLDQAIDQLDDQSSTLDMAVQEFTPPPTT